MKKQKRDQLKIASLQNLHKALLSFALIFCLGLHANASNTPNPSSNESTKDQNPEPINNPNEGEQNTPPQEAKDPVKDAISELPPIVLKDSVKAGLDTLVELSVRIQGLHEKKILPTPESLIKKLRELLEVTQNYIFTDAIIEYLQTEVTLLEKGLDASIAKSVAEARVAELLTLGINYFQEKEYVVRQQEILNKKVDSEKKQSESSTPSEPLPLPEVNPMQLFSPNLFELKRLELQKKLDL